LNDVWKSGEFFNRIYSCFFFFSVFGDFFQKITESAAKKFRNFATVQKFAPKIKAGGGH
jgi:hypothetical protein